ncbi:MAG: hypothetical protein M1837_003501 [Sclerophora amabilis]|nr:MAG: hypothetical protein M1837_003501 [Sclerophora amabilis]
MAVAPRTFLGASSVLTRGPADEQEKRYRSMQEHIRRAHPEHYISKLPATEESFALMINTPPSERPRESTSQGIGPAPYGHGKNSFHGEESSSPTTPRRADEHTVSSLLPAASAAAALAQLHNHKVDSDWESEQETLSEFEPNQRISSSIELPGIAQMKQEAGLHYPPFDSGRPRQLLPSIMSRSPPGRSSTLPPIQRKEKPARPRKSSITQNARKPQHERKRSRGEHAKRSSYDGRKALSAEPTNTATALGKRWEDLIDAATTATEEAEDDRTPVPQSPRSVHRASLPPFPTAHFHSYQASPLQHALTPPPPSYAPDPFPSVESGENFHIEPGGLEDSSPTSSSQDVQIYCAACQRVALLRSSFACTECICGICRQCVDVLVAELGARRRCPKCGTVGGRFRPFQLDIR